MITYPNKSIGTETADKISTKLGLGLPVVPHFADDNTSSCKKGDTIAYAASFPITAQDAKIRERLEELQEAARKMLNSYFACEDVISLWRERGEIILHLRADIFHARAKAQLKYEVDDPELVSEVNGNSIENSIYTNIRMPFVKSVFDKYINASEPFDEQKMWRGLKIAVSSASALAGGAEVNMHNLERALAGCDRNTTQKY